VLLVHGFGASLEHWRYNVPVLAEQRPVYAIDLLGFGFSDKPTIPNGFKCWGGHVWARQLLAFIDEVVKVLDENYQYISERLYCVYTSM
jgi:pimeloyl-ACP methyl ester carboxylesterase